MPNDRFIRALRGEREPTDASITTAGSADAVSPTSPIEPEGGYRQSPPVLTNPVAEHNRTLATLMTSRERPDAAAERSSIEDFASS
jgi:hypothetical protein